MVHFLTAERVTDRSLRRSVGSADAQTWDRRPPDLASRGGTPEAPAAPANGSGDASAGELPDVVDVSSPSPARFTVRQALALPSLLAFLFALASLSPAQESPKPPEPTQIVSVTRQVGSWSGRGTTTVGDVNSETGRLRIIWQTTNETPGPTNKKSRSQSSTT